MNDLIKTAMSIKPLLPGTLEKRYNICGKASCICKAKTNPKKHGPYYRLSFSVKGKNSSMFVKEKDAALVLQMTEAYKEHRNLSIELGLEFASLCKKIGFEAANQQFTDSLLDVKRDLVGMKPISAQQKACRQSKENWKEKAIERSKEINYKNVKINNLSKSRDNWKATSQNEKIETQALKKKIDSQNKQIQEQALLIETLEGCKKKP